ncbi:MAG TPA: putative glycolipid-binding domain-containing protein [Pseudolysinimonas sp.]|nr:putative glycolipid-binding domain-containing protein [Pseudolysinimonas sp.]
MADYVWRGLEYDGLERIRVEEGGMMRATSIIDSARGRYSYEVVCESDWTFRQLRLEAAAGERTLLITSNGRGAWTVNDEPRGDLTDAVDLDLSISPFTNTLPIRRLDLAVGDEGDVTAAYVSFPDLEVTVDEQRYTRLDEDLYLYESLDSDFSREITVDATGIVVEYPGLFERL